MSDIRLRKMTREDLPAVKVLAARLVRAHHAYDPERFMSPDELEHEYVSVFEKKLCSEDTILLVAEDGYGVVGYAYARMEPRSYNDLLDACGKLHDICVDERARRRGIGEALLREVLRRLKEKGAPRVVLNTAYQNTAAQRLFKRFGFRITMLEMTRELDDIDTERSPPTE